MALVDVLTGVSEVQVSKDDTSVVNDLNGLTTEFVVAEHDTLETLFRSANKQPLQTTDTYKVCMALVGRAPRGGYTIGKSTPLSASITLTTAAKAIKVKIANADFPANMKYAVAALIFLQINSADPQLAGFGLIDPTEDFVYSIAIKPLKKAATFPIGTLDGSGGGYLTNKILGPRSPLGVTFDPITPTTGGVRLIHRSSRISIRPDDAPDFDVITSKATDIQFSALVADNFHLTQNIGGNYVSFVDGAETVEQVESDLVSAFGSLNGNRAIKVYQPADVNGISTLRLFLGNLDVNNSDVTEATSKTDQLQVDFLLQAAALDYLTKNMHSTIWQKRYAT